MKLRSPSHPHPAPQQAAPDSTDAGAEMLGDGQERLARGVHHFGLVTLRLIETTLPLGNASLLAKADDRVLRDVKARADVRHGHADRVETSDLSALGHGERGELDPMRQTRQGGTLITGSQVRRQARDQLKERLPLFREGVGEGHCSCESAHHAQTARSATIRSHPCRVRARRRYTLPGRG